MKKFRILALVLACVMMIGMCVGCTSANDITVTLKFVLNDGSEFVTYELKVNAETPTVNSLSTKQTQRIPISVLLGPIAMS